MKKKFGTFKGVFVPSTEAILGTVLFLLMPHLVIQGGFLPMLAVVLLAHSVTLATSSSMADAATNLTKIEGGGLYALSKKSLGNAMGGAIGIQLYLAQAVSVGFYCIGFAEPLQPLLVPLLDFLPWFQGTGPETVLLQKQIIASFFFVLFFLIVMAGADFTLKIQIYILVVLGISVITILAGPLLGLTSGTMAAAASGSTTTEAVNPAMKIFTGALNLRGTTALSIPLFFIMFAQFFPAVTGISSGVGMSGDLATPQKSIVKGTFSAILITLIIYIFANLVFAFLNPITAYDDSGNPKLLTELYGIAKEFPGNLPGILILLGILFATCSSALSMFMTGPRTLQFLARDGILPRFMYFFKRDFKKEGTEPRYALLLTFFLGGSIIWMGDISFAATVVGILFLVVYAWMNGATFLERVSKNPSFRPTFKGHWLISLYGTLACLVAISLFSWQVGILVFASQFILFWLILRYKSHNRLEGIWWGVQFSAIQSGLRRLRKIVQGSHNWRPVVTAVGFCDEEDGWEVIGKLAESLAFYQGLVNLHLIKTARKFNSDVDTKKILIPASVIETSEPNQSILTLIQANGNSGVDSNTLLIQYHPKVENVSFLQKALEMNKNILYLKEGHLMKESGTIDIWWRGERNGNLMVLLAYIINISRRESRKEPYDIRIIRKLSGEETEEKAREELNALLDRARLHGEIKVLTKSDEKFLETLKSESESSAMVMMGLPGNYEGNAGKQENGNGRFMPIRGSIFKLDEFFFTREINNYKNLPATLFVRSARVMELD
ncbi:MAG: amino acid permease [Spirochaetales bacterium]|nr:amino acid permease [Spirochaetales bacterium]